MPGISIHVVDVASGTVAAGMRVELWREGAGGDVAVARGVIGSNGLFNDTALNATFAAGSFTAVFHVAEFYRAKGVPLPDPPFLDVVRYRFGLSDPAQHYHLPMKLTPWGYSCFRGGA